VRGTALVGFRVDGRGDVSQLRLERSAGHATLDAEALALVDRAAPLPAPPRGEVLRLSVPVVFE
ncbi:MAG: TonB family protein, partial [Gammaproteobacteria bacterium]